MAGEHMRMVTPVECDGERADLDDVLMVGICEREAALVVVARGELDASTVDTFRATLWAALRQSRRVVVDLSEVSFVAVAGMRVLAQAQDRATECGVSMRVVVAGRAPAVLARMAQAGHLRGLLLFQNVDEALLVEADTEGCDRGRR